MRHALATESICTGCFHTKQPGGPCPLCSHVPGAGRPGIALPEKTILKDRYLLGKLLGAPGGFGITYAGWDLERGQRIAVKECFPHQISARAGNGLDVAPDLDCRTEFDRVLRDFWLECNTLFRIRHPNVVEVVDVFPAHNTGYLVMPYYSGVSLYGHIVAAGKPLAEPVMVAIMEKILDGLGCVHAAGILHRDIKPPNIYLRTSQSPILLDFGAARAAGINLERSVILSDGFAPIEQYQRNGVQGPFTDVYGCGATLYWALTGEIPPNAKARSVGAPLLEPRQIIPSITPQMNEALLRAMEIDAARRPQSALEFMQMLPKSAPPPAPPSRTAAVKVPAAPETAPALACPTCGAKNRLDPVQPLRNAKCGRCLNWLSP